MNCFYPVGRPTQRVGHKIGRQRPGTLSWVIYRMLTTCLGVTLDVCLSQFDWLINFSYPSWSNQDYSMPNASTISWKSANFFVYDPNKSTRTLTSPNDLNKSTLRLTSPRVLHSFSSIISMGKKEKKDGTEVCKSNCDWVTSHAPPDHSQVTKSHKVETYRDRRSWQCSSLCVGYSTLAP